MKHYITAIVDVLIDRFMLKGNNLVMKTELQLRSLNTRNLLAYFKAERGRGRFYRYVRGMSCDCCGELVWNNEPGTHKREEKIYTDWKEYLETIEFILSTREHVYKTKTPKRKR